MRRVSLLATRTGYLYCVGVAKGQCKRKLPSTDAQRSGESIPLGLRRMRLYSWILGINQF
jgi:hypothetical protein